MGFRDELAGLQTDVGKTGPKCRISRIKDSLTGEDLAALENALADDTVPQSALSKYLTATFGMNIHTDQIRRHRNGLCVTCRDR